MAEFWTQLDAEIREGSARVTPQLRQTLEHCLQAGKASVRAAALLAFGKIRDGAAVSSLLAILADDDEDDMARVTAATALGVLRTPRATALLQRMTGDPSDNIHSAAAAALVAIATRPVYTFRFTGLPVHATRDPGQPHATPAITDRARLLQALGRLVDVQPITKRIALAKMLRLRDETLPADEVARRALQLPDQHFRFAALGILEHCTGPTVLAALTEALTDPDYLLRMYAARELVRKGGPLDLAPFAACLATTVLSLPDEAIESLVELGDVRGAGILIAALSHQRVDIRVQAGIALIALTGQDFGWDIEQWDAWWRTEHGQGALGVPSLPSAD